jgi:hypothetical protein
VGVDYLNDAVLGLDAAGPAIGLSTRDEIRAWPEPPACAIALVADTGDRLPVTVALRDRRAAAAPALMIGSGYDRSALTLSYIRTHWSEHRLRRAAERAIRSEKSVEVPIELPGGQVLEIPFQVIEDPPKYLVPLGVDELHGVLGIDFLRRWMQVFDFPGRQLLLFDYSASRNASNQSATSSRR